MPNCDPLRIFDRVEHGPGNCWLYTGGLQSSGYGIVSLNGKSVGTHRLAYELKVGPIPDGMCVLHRCDVRRCINPDHLFLGSKGDNNTDRKTKGRNSNRRGERNQSAKLNATSIKEIRELYAKGGISQRRLAEQFGVSQQQISCIIRGLFWNRKEL